MKKLLTSLVIMALTSVGCNSCTSQETHRPPVGIPDAGPVVPKQVIWEDYERARDLCMLTGRPMLLYFHADWCPYCKKVDEEVWKDTRIIDLVRKEGYVSARIDADAREDLLDRYGVKGVPRILVVEVDKKGDEEVVERVRGYYEDIDVYLDALDR